ncbi:Sir2 family NAD-dependent protein deacetylase [Streptomyces sp. NPDC051997]|uniref:Sir2 family NAD-dependent protein deacetylase n=1 Tax=Streptomyces sp. NPDC051997 TaxID=3155611 RepID=UPI003434B35D
MPCDSGIPDYRGPDGLWRKDPEAEKLVTYEYYMSDPQIRRRAWLMRRESGALRAEPNAAHRAVAELERSGAPVRARLVVVNAEPTPYDDRADEVVREPIGTALPELLRRLHTANR